MAGDILQLNVILECFYAAFEVFYVFLYVQTEQYLRNYQTIMNIILVIKIHLSDHVAGSWLGKIDHWSQSGDSNHVPPDNSLDMGRS